MTKLKQYSGEIVRVGGAALTVAAAVPFAQKYADALRTLPWQELTAGVSIPVAAYGAGEVINAVRDRGDLKGQSTAYRGTWIVEHILKAAPLVAPLISHATDGDVIKSMILPAAACILGYGIELGRKAFGNLRDQPLLNDALPD